MRAGRTGQEGLQADARVQRGEVSGSEMTGLGFVPRRKESPIHFQGLKNVENVLLGLFKFSYETASLTHKYPSRKHSSVCVMHTWELDCYREPVGLSRIWPRVIESKREGASWKQGICLDSKVLHKSLMSPRYFHLPCLFFRCLSVRLSTFLWNETMSS